MFSSRQISHKTEQCYSEGCLHSEYWGTSGDNQGHACHAMLAVCVCACVCPSCLLVCVHCPPCMTTQSQVFWEGRWQNQSAHMLETEWQAQGGRSEGGGLHYACGAWLHPSCRLRLREADWLRGCEGMLLDGKTGGAKQDRYRMRTERKKTIQTTKCLHIKALYVVLPVAYNEFCQHCIFFQAPSLGESRYVLLLLSCVTLAQQWSIKCMCLVKWVSNIFNIKLIRG